MLAIKHEKYTPDRFRELETANADRPLVLQALAQRHTADGRADDAARCWARRIELSPDSAAYRTLAAAYQKQGQTDKWLKTLEDSLKTEDTGLLHARARVDIAKHYMGKKQYEKAEPFALDAAETHAAWALICAAECEAKLEKWDEANAFYRATAERYDNQIFPWYYACRRSGKMDRNAAEDAVAKYLDGFAGGIPAGLAFDAGRFYLFSGRPKKAVAEFDRDYAARPYAMCGLFAALVADDLGDTAGRDARLAKTAAGPGPAGEEPHLRAAAGKLSDWATKGTVPDAAAVQTAVSGLTPGQRADVYLYFGWYLSNRGQPARAAELWKECLKEPDGSNPLKTHAKTFLDVRKPPKK